MNIQGLHQDFGSLITKNKALNVAQCTHAKPDLKKLQESTVNKLLLSRSDLGKVTSDNAQEKCAEELDTFPPKGWLLHSSDKDRTERRHLWKMEDHLLTLFLSESESLFYKQIPLSSVIDMKKLKNGKQFQLVLRDALLTVSPSIKDTNRCRTATSRWYSAIKKAKKEAKRPKTDALTDHSKNKENGGIFDGIQFALDLESSSFDAKKQLRELITGNGGQISYIITRNTKWLVVCAEEKAKNPTTYKQRKALKLGIPVISENFLRRSVEEGKLFEIDVASVKKDNENFSKGKILAPVLESLPEKAEKFNLKKIIKYKIDDAECPEFPEEYHVPKYSILETEKKEKKIVCVEAHIGTLGENKATTKIFRVMVSSKLSSEKVSRFIYPVSSISDLTKCYETLVRKFLDVGMKRVNGISNPEFSDVVSEPLGLILSEMKTSAGIIHPEVMRLIKSAWIDSLGELKIYMGVDPENITLHQVRNAMIALLKIEEALKCEKFTPKMSDEFYKNMSPRNAHEKTPIDTIQKVAKKREMCQLIKDIVNANENSWLSTRMSSAYSQYTALKCAFTWLDPQGTAFKLVKDLLPDQTDKFKFIIQNIFKVNRTTENFEFRRDLSNKKLLFHASAAINFVGIFSRGLLMPSTVTSELGIARRDEGNLGSGIYFSDSFEMSSGYATKSQNRGARLMLVNEVALGKTYDTREPKADLVSPPDGFHSVKGIELTEKGNSEYAVYNSNQQRMRYVIEFTLNNEMAVVHDTNPLSVPFAENSSGKNTSAREISENMDPPVKQMQYGLVMESEGASANLEEVHIRAKIIDLVSEVTLFQSYVNTTRGRTVEAKYVFPLADNAAVCGFEAFINEKHVIGEVKEKEQAHREYKKAVAEGHGAYLMDEEKPNVFTVSVGNIPVRARVVIKITYIVELETVNEPDSSVLFILPGSVAQWEQDSTLLSSSITQSTTESVAVAKGKRRSSLMVSVDMPFDILDINSPTHKIVTKKTATKACVKLQKTEFLGGNDFRLLVKVSEIHIPRIWIETDELDKDGEQVAMVTFFPEFDFDPADDFDCTILLDMSTSMAGPSASYSKYVANMLIDKLPENCNFNVLAFGSNFEECFIGFESASNKVKELAKTFVAQSQPCRGGSDLLHILSSVNSMLENKETQRLHNIFLLSDGHLSEEERILRLASRISKRSFSQTRIFTFGIGSSINSHLLSSLSVLTGGRHEHFSPSTKNTWKAQLQNQITFAAQPALTDVRIDWCNYENTETRGNEILHVPEKVKCVFSGSRLTAYSFVPGCTKATLNAKIHGKEFSTVIMAHGLSQVKGKTLHRLATKAVFKEYESGRLAEDGYVDQVVRDQRKSSIISLSVKYSVVSKFTSFIAVEKRDKDEDMSITAGPPVNELVEAAFEDIIPQTGWGFEGLTTEENIDELLKRSSQLQTGSILQARELALLAKALCKNLTTDDNIRELKVSAALCKLNATPEEFDACKVLSRNLKISGGNLNYDVLNSISRCQDPLVPDAIGELASSFWPDYCSVQLASLPQKLRPLAVGFFVTCCNLGAIDRDIKKFVQNHEQIADFWSEMHNIDMKEQDDITADVMRQLKKAEGNMHKLFVLRRRKAALLRSRSAHHVPDMCNSSSQELSSRAGYITKCLSSLMYSAPPLLSQGDVAPPPREAVMPRYFSRSVSYKKSSVAPSLQRRSKQSSVMYSAPPLLSQRDVAPPPHGAGYIRKSFVPSYPQRRSKQSSLSLMYFAPPHLSQGDVAPPPPPPRDEAAPRVTDGLLLTPQIATAPFPPSVIPDAPPPLTQLAAMQPPLIRTSPTLKAEPPRPPQATGLVFPDLPALNQSRMMMLGSGVPSKIVHRLSSVASAGTMRSVSSSTASGPFSEAPGDSARDQQIPQVLTGGGFGFQPPPPARDQRSSQVMTAGGFGSQPPPPALDQRRSQVLTGGGYGSQPPPPARDQQSPQVLTGGGFNSQLPPPVRDQRRSQVLTGGGYGSQPPPPARDQQSPQVLTGGGFSSQPPPPARDQQIPQVLTGGGYGSQPPPPARDQRSPQVLTGGGYRFQPPPRAQDQQIPQLMTGGGFGSSQGQAFGGTRCIGRSLPQTFSSFGATNKQADGELHQGFRFPQKQISGGARDSFFQKPAFSNQSLSEPVNTSVSYEAPSSFSRRFGGSSISASVPGSMPPPSSGAASVDSSVALKGTKLSTPSQKLSTNVYDDTDLPDFRCKMVPSSRAVAEEKEQLKSLEALEKKCFRNSERIESSARGKMLLIEAPSLDALCDEDSIDFDMDDDTASSSYASRRTDFLCLAKSHEMSLSSVVSPDMHKRRVLSYSSGDSSGEEEFVYDDRHDTASSSYASETDFPCLSKSPEKSLSSAVLADTIEIMSSLCKRDSSGRLETLLERSDCVSLVEEESEHEKSRSFSMMQSSDKDFGYVVERGQTDPKSPIMTLINLLKLSDCNVLDECSTDDVSFCKFPSDDEIDRHDPDDSEIKMLKICKEIIIAAGGRSLGTRCLAAALNILLTSIMLEMLKVTWIRNKDQEVKDEIYLVKKWIKSADTEQPFLYRRLELGLSWEDAARNVMTKIAAKLSS